MPRGSINSRLISAVRDGKIKIVRELLASCSLSHTPVWSDGYILLRVALKNKRTKITRLLLKYGPKINSKNKYHFTPLHYAVINGDIDIVQKLLDRGANINAIDQNNKTPLYYAVECKKMEIIELLISHGANVNGNYWSRITPLHLAVRKSTKKIVELLLRWSADVHVNGTHGTPLHMAADIGNLQIVQLLLKYGADVNPTCSSEYQKGTPLKRAVEKGHKDVIKLLLKSGANVNAQDENGKSILYFAVEKGCEEVVNLLLESGANVDAQDKDGRTILYFAIGNGHSVIVKDILKHCPDLNNKSNRSVLSVAMQRYGTQYKDIIKDLLHYGFTVNPEDAKNYKFLHAAIEKGCLTIVEQLLKYDTDVNKLYNISGRGYMALHTATKKRREKVAELLIKYGADVNARDMTGNAPIVYATENTDLKMVELLLTNKANVKDYPELLKTAVEKNCRKIIEIFLQHGVDVRASDKYGLTALYFTAIGKYKGTAYAQYKNVKGQIAKLLLSKGAYVNARVNDGTTTLHAAICKGYVKVVEALLEYNADVNIACNSGKTPLCYAAEKGNEVITQMLLKKGANINAKDKTGETALHIATAKHRKQVLEVLLKYGARVDSKTTTGTTPLHMAALYGDSDIVHSLVTFGADIDCKNKFGETALHIASKEGRAQIVTTLLDHGSDITIMIKDTYTALDLAEAGVRSFYSKRRNIRYLFDYYDDYDPKNSAHAVIVKILKLHMVKLKAANLYARNQHLLSIISNEKFSSFRNECEEEIISMKSENVGNANITFYNILTKGISQLAVYAGNESVVQVLKSNDYEIKFPIYASTINTHFRNGERRKELLDEGNTTFNSFFNFLGLPHVCTERIFNYLSDADLRTLMDACRPISVNNSDININNVIVTLNISKM